MKKNKIFLFNNKKGMDMAGKIIAFFLAFSLGYLVLNIFVGQKAIAETNINQQILKAQFGKCKMEYEDAIERNEVAKDIDVDKDRCHDALDICIADNSQGDKDLDGVPDPCDFVDGYANVKDGKKHSQRLLCIRMGGNYWDKTKEICCSPYYKTELKDGEPIAPICKNAEQ